MVILCVMGFFLNYSL